MEKFLVANSKHNILHWLAVSLLRLVYLCFWLPITVSIIATGYLLLKHGSTWWIMVVGLPLIALGVSLLLIVLFNFLQAVFDRFYNQTHCPFCQKSVKIKVNGYF